MWILKHRLESLVITVSGSDDVSGGRARDAGTISMSCIDTIEAEFYEYYVQLY